MTTKVNGAAYAGVWVEKKVSFVKLTFSQNIAALDETMTYLAGTTTQPSATTVADATFGVVESALVQALKTLETKATILAVSAYSATANTVDVMLGNSEGWFADTNGLIATGLPVSNAKAVVTTGGVTPTTLLGSLVDVRPSAVTFKIEFAAFDGKMTVQTAANGLSDGPGGPTGSTGFYPGSV
jgi:hypothetical protein